MGEKGITDKTLEPGPYCPDTGQAHITCKALLAVAFVAFWLLRVCNEAEERTGMASHHAPQG